MDSSELNNYSTYIDVKPFRQPSLTTRRSRYSNDKRYHCTAVRLFTQQVKQTSPLTPGSAFRHRYLSYTIPYVFPRVCHGTPSSNTIMLKVFGYLNGFALTDITSYFDKKMVSKEAPDTPIDLEI